MKLTAAGAKGLILPGLSLMISIAQLIVNDKKQQQMINQAVNAKVDTIVSATATSVINNLTQPAEITGKTAELLNNK